MQKKFPIDINTLNPVSAKFKLDAFEGEKFTLEPFSMYVRSWALKRWSAAELKKILEEARSLEMAEIAYFMLDDAGKARFPEMENFFKVVRSPRDQLDVINAVFLSVGVAEPDLKEIAAVLKKVEDERKENAVDPKTKAPKKSKTARKTGQKSSTSYPVDTVG